MRSGRPTARRRRTGGRPFAGLAALCALAALGSAGVALGSGGGEAESGDAPAGEPALQIEPGHATLPANHLKFYLQFPGPMERGEVFRHLRLVELDAGGGETAEVSDPFRDVELWDESFTRLTLWLHPGRQKPGVNLFVEIGPVLREGARYRLEISGRWRDESGRPLGETLRHDFAAGPPAEDRPDPAAWRLAMDGDAPVLHADRLLDPVTAREAISAIRADGTPVEDLEPEILALEGADGTMASAIRLRRVEAWTSENYWIVVDPKIEDLAGNSLARPFNVDLQRDPDFEARTEPFLIPLKRPLLIPPAKAASRGPDSPR